MRFIVCARNRSDGGTIVVDQRSYADKDAAIAALGNSSSLGSLAQCELFVLDLDSGTPVVLVRAQPEMVISQAALPELELPSDEGSAEDASESAPAPSPEAEIGERLEESDLWSLVDAITDEPMDTLNADDVAPAPWWVDAAPSEDVIQVSIYDCSDDFSGEPPAEATAVTGYAPVSDAGSDHEAETVGAHEGAVLAADLQAAAEDSAARAEAAEEPARDEMPDVAGDRTAEALLDDARLSADPLPDVIEVPESDPGLMSIDFDAWTCVDCVFTTTCDRTSDESPSDCGSFQWRPAD